MSLWVVVKVGNSAGVERGTSSDDPVNLSIERYANYNVQE